MVYPVSTREPSLGGSANDRGQRHIMGQVLCLVESRVLARLQ